MDTVLCRVHAVLRAGAAVASLADAAADRSSGGSGLRPAAAPASLSPSDR